MEASTSSWGKVCKPAKKTMRGNGVAAQSDVRDNQRFDGLLGEDEAGAHDFAISPGYDAAGFKELFDHQRADHRHDDEGHERKAAI